MVDFEYDGKIYKVDARDFLDEFEKWDENFAEGMAKKYRIYQGLTKEHWDIIYSIREKFKKTGQCPLVYETCRHNGIHLRKLRELFPTGYLRGACRIAGITYKEGYIGQSYLPSTADDLNTIAVDKTYHIDVRGFLVNPDEWDEYFAAFRAYDMKIPGGKLTDRHWRIIKYIRDSFTKTGNIPTVYETCEANEIDLDELEQLFPDGYHRGVIKIAGLRER